MPLNYAFLNSTLASGTIENFNPERHRNAIRSLIEAGGDTETRVIRSGFATRMGPYDETGYTAQLMAQEHRKRESVVADLMARNAYVGKLRTLAYGDLVERIPRTLVHKLGATIFEFYAQRLEDYFDHIYRSYSWTVGAPIALPKRIERGT